ncbi:MAG TPA: efflux RND transporter periplasmic adaptor subunit [Vicinamibacterales bacterium]|nr:efflux RND transporter periplasmic adaptor subunit [Vicinamibacterales bacterium]
MRKPGYLILLVVVVALAAAGLLVSARGTDRPADGQGRQRFIVARRDFVRSVRLSGTVEAVEATTVSAPRIAGQNNNALVIMHLVVPGTTVRPGDLLVEFDRQDQLRNALDRQAELTDLDQQINKRVAQEAAAKATDDTALKEGESALERARLDMLKNELLPRIEAEKNTLAYEQADATLKQLRATYDLKRRAAAADIRVLQISRDRSATAMKHAEANANRMLIQSPIRGVAVLKTIWKGGNMAEIQIGDEIRPGVPVVDVVNPAAMRVRARVNQADINELVVGQPVAVGLDAYPELHFTGRVAQISPIGAESTLSPKVRTFTVLVTVQGAHPKLMPDLTASLDVELARVPKALVVPRDAIGHDGAQAFVQVLNGGNSDRRNVTIGARNAVEAVVTSGLAAGAAVARNLRPVAAR